MSSTPLPIDLIIRKPVISKVTLSMDGKFIAAIHTNEKDRQLLMTRNIKTGEEFYLKERNNGDIYNYVWASNNRIVYNVSKMKMYHMHMGVIDRRLEKKEIFCFDAVGWPVDGLLNDSNQILLLKHYRGSYRTIGFENINTFNYKKLEYGIKGMLMNCITDIRGRPKTLSIYKKGNAGTESLYYYDGGSNLWKGLNTKKEFNILKASQNGRKLYVTAEKKDEKFRSLYIYDINADKYEKKIYSTPKFDFDGTLAFFEKSSLIDGKYALKGIIYETDLPKSHWFDEKMEAVQRQVDMQKPGSANLIIDSDATLSRFLVSSYSDKKPQEYYCYDDNTHTLKLLCKARPWVNPELMSPMKPITFLTRDSLELHGYLTEPRNCSAPYSTILFIHGGPWARDYWGFDSEVQVLASRGYAVLQVNYRGSTGFGKVISRDHEFSFKEMHNDITDAANYLIKEKISHPRRICIMGGSFGGYLSICGVAFEPDLYCCAISNAGVFDWRRHVRSKFGKYNNYAFDYFRSNLGEGDKKQYLEEVSPINAVKNIKVPVLVCGGASDKRVKISQSIKLLSAMRRAGVKVERFLKASEGHGFRYQKNQIKYYNKVFEFLDQHMHLGIKK